MNSFHPGAHQHQTSKTNCNTFIPFLIGIGNKFTAILTEDLEEFNLFIDTVMDKYEAWMGFQIMFWTGMRVGELLALKVEDIDFENKTIRIDESYTRLNKKDIISTPKTERSIRVIVIHDELCDDLKEYISHLYRARAGSRLFPEKTKHFFQKELKRGIKASGVKEISVHCLRHSHCIVGISDKVKELGVMADVVAPEFF